MVSVIYFGTKFHSFNIDTFPVIIISHLDTRIVRSCMYRVALHNKTDGHTVYCQMLNVAQATSSRH